MKSNQVPDEAGIDPSGNSDGMPLIPTISDDQLSQDCKLGLPEYNDTEIQNNTNSSNYELSANFGSQRNISDRYDFDEAICVKTSERILDDLRSDPLFLLNNKNGILSSPTRSYSKQLSQLVHNTSFKYETVFWNTTDPTFSSYQTIELENNYSLSVFTGLLIPKKKPTSEFSNERLFHYSLKIKYPNNKVRVKSTFYGFHDEQLTQDDRLFIDAQTIMEESTDIPPANVEVLLKSLPILVDSANFISKETETIIRVEIYPSILDQNQLELFNITEIQTRIATFNSQEPSSFEKTGLTPNDCFLKLKSALTGALKHKDDADIKTIDLQTTKLQVMLDIEMLMSKFFFTISEKDGHSQMTPIQFASLGEYRFVCEDFFKRAVVETVYFISITSMQDNGIGKYFSNSFNDVFEVIKEFDIFTQIQNWNNWNDQYYSESMILLSVCPYYSDQYIQHMYELLIKYDPVHIPLYFDALFYCATSRNSDNLPYYVALLKDNGFIGFSELKGVFNALGFTDASTCEIISQINDEQVLTSYKNQIILAISKYEKTTLRQNLEKISKFRSSNMLKEYLNTEPYFDVEDAYNLLGISPSVDDSTMTMYYDFKMSESINFDVSVARAFYTIVLARKSIILLSYVENNLPQFAPPPVPLADSYQYIGCTETADDAMIVRIFQERLNKDSGVAFPTLWRCLKTIANFRNSKLLEGFLSTGMIDSTFLRLDQSPAGLNNIGNTCYLNSLLQYYFVIKPLREYILGFNDVFNAEEFENEEKYSIRRIGGRTVGIKETERSYQFMYQLRDLYYQLIHENNRCVTPSRELAYLAFSPISFEVEFEEAEEKGEDEDEIVVVKSNDGDEEFEMIKSESSGVIELGTGKENKVEEKERPAANETSVISLDSDDSRVKPVTEKKKTAAVCNISPDQFESAFEIGSQQDVTECISNVLIQIESAMKPDHLDETNEQLDMIKKLFYGKTKQRLVPVDKVTKEELPEAGVRTKLESFLNLIVNIGDHPKDIYDALDTYFTEDLLDLEDGEVKRSLTITELPKILQIQIQRVQFDRVRLMPVKSNDPIPFSNQLYMDRYLETEDQTIITKRQEVFHWRRRVGELNKKREEIQNCNEQGMTIRDALKTTRSYLQSSSLKEVGISVENNTFEVLDSEIERLDTELSSINTELEDLQLKISRQFECFDKVGYSIFAIFIHRGQASYGHYFIYIRDPKSDVYRKYNDEIVSEVSLEEVYNFADGNTATPYYLTFIKDELLDQITPLQRDILIHDSLEELNKTHMDVD